MSNTPKKEIEKGNKGLSFIHGKKKQFSKFEKIIKNKKAFSFNAFLSIYDCLDNETLKIIERLGNHILKNGTFSGDEKECFNFFNKLELQKNTELVHTLYKKRDILLNDLVNGDLFDKREVNTGIYDEFNSIRMKYAEFLGKFLKYFPLFLETLEIELNYSFKIKEEKTTDEIEETKNLIYRRLCPTFYKN